MPASLFDSSISQSEIINTQTEDNNNYKLHGYCIEDERYQADKLISCQFSDAVSTPADYFVSCLTLYCPCTRFYTDHMDINTHSFVHPKQGNVDRLRITTKSYTRDSPITLKVIGIERSIHLDMLHEDGRRAVLIVDLRKINEILVFWAEDIVIEMSNFSLRFTLKSLSEFHFIHFS